MIFPLRTILTVTTGLVLTKPKSESSKGIADLYDILEYMTGKSVYTHNLTRFIKECSIIILKRYPELNKVNVDQLDTMTEDDKVDLWLEKCETELGLKPVYEIYPINEEDHTIIEPLIELQEMMSR